MHWLCFPLRLFNIEMRALETGKAISRSELGLFQRTAPASEETGSWSALGHAHHMPPGLPVGSLTLNCCHVPCSLPDCSAGVPQTPLVAAQRRWQAGYQEVRHPIHAALLETLNKTLHTHPED